MSQAAIMKEAMRLARNTVRKAMKRQGIKVSHVKATEITKCCKMLIQSSPRIIGYAKRNLNRRVQP